MSPRPPAPRSSGSSRPGRPGGAARSTRPPRPAGARTRPEHRAAPEGLGGDQVEGRQAVLELLAANRRTTRKILIAEAQESADILDKIENYARGRRIPVEFVSWARLDKEARTEGHQGVMALAHKLPSVALDDLMTGADPFLLVCDGVTDPRNLGAMLRSADGAGVSGIVLPRHRTARITPAVTKTAVGAIEYLTFAEVGGVPSAIGRLNKAGFLTVGLAGESTTSLYDLDLASTPIALVVGGEHDGLSALTRKRCGAVVSIPQRGKISSLNAGVASSIAMFEAARQRKLR